MRQILTPKGLFIHERCSGFCMFTPDVKAERWIKPLYAQVAITDYCPLKCPYCYASSSPENSKFYPKEELLELVRFFDRWGLLGVALGGGEPFTHPDLAEIVKSIWTETGLDLSITTNGVCVSESVLDMLEGYVSEIRVSAHTSESLKILPKLLRRKFEVGVNILLFHGEAEKVEQIIGECLKIGVKDFLINSFLPVGRGADYKHLEPEEEDYRKLAGIVENFKRKAEIKVSGRLAEKLKAYGLSFIPFSQEERGSIIAVTVDRKVKPTSLSNEEYPFTEPKEIPRIYRSKICAEGSIMVRKIAYTRHALLRMKRRNISTKDIENVLSSKHGRLVNTMRGVFVAVRREPPLVIVYKLHDKEEIKVITVFSPTLCYKLFAISFIGFAF